MPRPLAFRTIAQKMLDVWIQTDAEKPGRADVIYAGVLEYLSKTMRMTVYHTVQDDPMDWYLETIRPNTIQVTASVDFEDFFRSQRIRDFKDQHYVRTAVLPTVPEVHRTGKHRMEFVRSEIFGNEIGYHRLLLPQKTKGLPEWIISFSDARYLLNKPTSTITPDESDRVLVQLLAEGKSAKEIAKVLNVSHRTIEHRLERMKERYGARNLPHLVAMLISRQASQTGGASS